MRAFKSVGYEPIFIKRAKGLLIYDVDRISLLTMSCHGSHDTRPCKPKVTKMIKNAISKGTSYGAPTALEVRFAKMLNEAFPSMELVRLVSSGTGGSNERPAPCPWFYKQG